MIRKICCAIGVALAAGGAFADTPIGPGVTGSGGTGANSADAKLRAGAGGEAAVQRQDGMPADRADSNARAKAGAGASVGAGAYGSAGGTVLPPAEASMGKNFSERDAKTQAQPSDAVNRSGLPPAEAGMGK